MTNPIAASGAKSDRYPATPLAPDLNCKTPPNGTAARRLIRVLDVVFALLAALLTAPLLALIAALLKLDSPGPVLFRQERLGQYRRPFVLIKFRSMRIDAERDGPRWACDADPRVTRVGRLLRRSRLDELPQLWNILRGELCFIGPRPIRAVFADQLTEHDSRYALRFLVKPGLSGWAQLYAPYGSSVKDQLSKLPYDLRYSERPTSLAVYLTLIVLTVFDVLRLRGR